MTELRIEVEEHVYRELTERVGLEEVGRVLNNLARRPPTDEELEQGYAAMAADEEGEREALEWIEGVIEDFGDDDEHWPEEWRTSQEG